jgi:hypothetical protein
MVVYYVYVCLSKKVICVCTYLNVCFNVYLYVCVFRSCSICVFVFRFMSV